MYHVNVVTKSFLFLPLKEIVRDGKVMREDDHFICGMCIIIRGDELMSISSAQEDCA